VYVYRWFVGSCIGMLLFRMLGVGAAELIAGSIVATLLPAQHVTSITG
jgi:putative Ca2+/H+ antiporter (TMEM165/GDT1 family)